MKNKEIWSNITKSWFIIVCFSIFFALTGSLSFVSAEEYTITKTKWWEVTPEVEAPSAFYDSLPYSQIGPKLYEIQKNSKGRVRVSVMGQSAGGRDLFLVTIAAPGDSGRFGHYKRLRKLMLDDPNRALRRLRTYTRFKVPVFLNGSIHGDEYPGTDACMELIEYFAYSNSPEVEKILSNVILLINVVQNPDGRVMGTRRNANGFDINRDMITQSQPESRATAKVISEWNPMIFLDLHGFVNPMLIEPCTPPHNPNYEYDLYLKWALELAYAMSDKVIADNDEITETRIPYIDWDYGWDDWPPIYAAMYPMLHGAIGHTLETPARDGLGVRAHYSAAWAAINYVADNKMDMIKDQIEGYKRGVLDMPQIQIPAGLLDDTPHDQFNHLTTMEFPTAYVIPVDGEPQENPVQAAEFIEFLLFNGVEVEASTQAFVLDGVTYPIGTYVVWMDQAKRSLANTILEDGMDVSSIPGLYFYSPPSAWSHPLLWGVSRSVVDGPFSVATASISSVMIPEGSLESGPAAAYAVVPDTLQAFKKINEYIATGDIFFRSKTGFADAGQTFPAGAIVFVNTTIATELKNDAFMDVFTLDALPGELATMEQQQIAALGDEGLNHALKTMGFEFTIMTSGELETGIDLSSYDLFILGGSSRRSGLDVSGAQPIKDFILAGGDFIALGRSGNQFVNEVLMMPGDESILDYLDIESESADGNAIVNINLSEGNLLTCGFPAKETVFVYSPAWYPVVGANVEVAATLDAENLLVSGFIPGWETLLADDKAIMLLWENPANLNQDMVLIGFDATFRGHPKQSFKFLGNAIFSGLE